MTDLCTIAQVKTESAGRITGETLDTDIAYKITDLSEKILEIDSTLTSDDRTARMCCIYGVLGWLTNNKKGEDVIKETSDNQRYKVLGNAVTTNVVKSIIERMF